VLLTGIPLSVVLTPFVYAVVLVGGYAASAVSSVPLELWQRIRDMPLALVATSGVRALGSGATVLTPQQVAGLAAALVLPGAVLLLLVWFGLRVVFRHAGVGGVLLSLGARQPNADDLEERRLVDVVEEMAIAAGVKAPRVMLIDGEAADGAANAAAVGWSIDDATILVTRPLLNQLSRDDTQAIIAFLIASVGNGDLKIALIVLSLFQTVGAATLVLNSFFGRRSRHALWQLLRLVFTTGRSRDRAALESDVMTMLAGASDADGDASRYMETHQQQGCMGMLQLPLVMGVGFPIMTSNFIVGMSAAMFTGPIIGLLWKRRVLLADATAVQLTRNPDGLAGALERLAETNVHVLNADAVSHLFAVWSDQRGLTPEQRAEVTAIFSRGDAAPDRMRALIALSAKQRSDARAQQSSAAEAQSSGSSVATMSHYMHAKLERRLAQLHTLGAHVDPGTRPAVTPAGALRPQKSHLPLVLMLIIAPLAILMVGLLGVALALMIGLDLLFTTIMLLVVWGLAHFAFIYLPRALAHARK
jgi:Zn-dependent protease with chaperone function